MPRFSIIVPTRDRPDLLRQLLWTLRQTTWRPFEVILVDNDTRDAEARQILARTPHRVVRAPIPFNYARLVNMGAAVARGEILLLTNNDLEVVQPSWLDHMVGALSAPGVGAVGALLRYPDGTVQHAGVALQGGVPAHVLRGVDPDENTLARTARDCLAVTAACMAVRRETFCRVDGFDPLFGSDYNDIDFCLRLRREGLAARYVPQAELIHHESVTRGTETTAEGAADWFMFRTRWAGLLAAPDPYWSTEPISAA